VGAEEFSGEPDMTTTTLDDALKSIQAIILAADIGIRAAPDYAPDNLPPGIFSVVLPASGTYGQKPAGVLWGLHNILLYVVCPRVDLPKTLAAIIPLGDAVATALVADPHLNASVSTFATMNYTFSTNINLGTASDPVYYAGWIFTLTGVKIEDPTALEA
jgi:hypothetical protein